MPETVPIAGEQMAIAAKAPDLSEAVAQQRDQDYTVDLLRLIHRATGTADLIRGATALLQSYTGCEAVGIRLRDGGDFPYYETRGFPPSFVEAERYLCARDLQGQIGHDGAGGPVLECLCGGVLSGTFDSSSPFCRPSGAFWTNSLSEAAAAIAAAHPDLHLRGRCLSEGYESLAQVPLRTGGQTFGLLQLDGRRPHSASGPSRCASGGRSAWPRRCGGTRRRRTYTRPPCACGG